MALYLSMFIAVYAWYSYNSLAGDVWTDAIWIILYIILHIIVGPMIIIFSWGNILIRISVLEIYAIHSLNKDLKNMSKGVFLKHDLSLTKKVKNKSTGTENI